MPPKTKITKEQVESAAYEIARKRGLKAVTAKALAVRLRCSTQPIYWSCGTMEAIRSAVLARANEEYRRRLFSPIAGIPAYKAAGLNYIKFAAEEGELYRMLFLSDRKGDLSILESTLDENKGVLVAMIRNQTDLTEEKANELYAYMWIFSHGIATMVAAGAAQFSPGTIGKMLTDAYQGFLCRLGGRER